MHLVPSGFSSQTTSSRLPLRLELDHSTHISPRLSLSLGFVSPISDSRTRKIEEFRNTTTDWRKKIIHLHFLLLQNFLSRQKATQMNGRKEEMALTRCRIVFTTSLFDTDSTLIKPIRTPNFSEIFSLEPIFSIMFCIFSLA